MAGDATRGPQFDIPAHPERRYPYEGGVEYDGSTVFVLRPSRERSDDCLRALVETTLSDGPYRHGDFVDLPMPLYLVRDDETDDVFRVSVRDGRIRFHVLPETESAGLRALYRRLAAQSDADWQVQCRTDH